jgi:hypothetical protein
MVLLSFVVPQATSKIVTSLRQDTEKELQLCSQQEHRQTSKTFVFQDHCLIQIKLMIVYNRQVREADSS